MNASSDPWNKNASGLVPESATAAKLLSLLGLDAADPPDVTALWAQRDALRRIPLGLQAGGSPVWLDLDDGIAGGNGPHGLLAGAAGAGKSTVLQSMLFALCALHSPDQLQLMLLTSKGQSVFDDFAGYPHVVDIPAGGDHKRILLDLLAGRAERGAGGALTEPSLVVVVDDLPLYDNLDADIGFTATLCSLMRICSSMQHGRKLGLHVLVGAQTLPPAFSMQLTAQTDYRIAMRTATAEESRQLIGSAGACELPPSAGIGLFCPSQSADPVPFRAFQIPRDLVRDVGRQLASR